MQVYTFPPHLYLSTKTRQKFGMDFSVGGSLIVLLFSTLDDTCYVNVVFTSREMKVVTNISNILGPYFLTAMDA